MNKILIKMGCAAALVVALGACSNMPGIYKTDIKQGHNIEENRLAKILPGMSQEEVQLILGKPLVNDSFNEHIWYYTYLYHKSNGKKIAQSNVKVYFDQQKRVTRVE